MAKLARYTQNIFGNSAPGSGVGALGVFGSLAGGNPTVSTSPSTIMGLAAWAGGWLSAVIGDNGPEMEDMNGFCFVSTYQLAYLFQQGVPEWDAGTTYYTGSFVNVGGILYQSLQDANTNHAVLSTLGTWWGLAGFNVAKVNANTAMSPTVQYYRVDTSGGNPTLTLPALASSLNIKFKVKNISTGVVTVAGNSGSEDMDGANTYTLNAYESIDLIGTADPVWDII